MLQKGFANILPLLLIIGISLIAFFYIRNNPYSKSSEMELKEVRKDVVFKPETIINKSDWETLSNQEAQFTIKHPSTWTASNIDVDIDQYDKGLFSKSIILVGKEGEINIEWTNIGYGGACPDDPDNSHIQLNGIQRWTCHTVGEREYWGGIVLQNESPHPFDRIVTFIDSHTNDLSKDSREMVLNILSTLAYNKN